MLKQRIITAVVLVPVVVGLIVFSPTWVVSILAALLMLAGAFEWSGLIGFQAVAWRIAYVLFVGVCIGG
ncbi:MAG: CDP-diglyceride synthetase, partial [Gammaproteobacteria bacterium]|nr:CDP-diglyceride synthetase [Gammaproteobacteria bacterium]